MSGDTNGKTPGNRLFELDGLRAISILLVLAAHMLPLGPKFLRLNDVAGAMGMSLFFALSGFLITSALLARPDVKAFLVRRLARILPLYFLYLVLVFLFWDHSLERLVQSALFTQNYQTQFLDAYSGHLWSLCVEIHFYIAIAFGVALLGRQAIWLVWPACLAVTLMRMGAGEVISIRTHHRVDEILAGACVATLYARFGHGWLKASAAKWCAVFVAMLWIVGSVPQSGVIAYFRPYGSAAVLASAIWAAPVTLRNILGCQPLRYIAEISYALYVIHPATVAGWMNDGSITTRYLLKRPLSFALTFALAHMSTFYWEAIWRNWASTYLRKPKSAPHIGTPVPAS
jgi:peptidoglycan/LPS O-acetylase OafA/YrhL